MTKRLVNAEILITLAFLLTAIGVVTQAQQWPFRAALFPVLAGWLLLGFSALKLAIDVAVAVKPAPAHAPSSEAPAAAAGDDDEDDHEEEDVFQTASAGEWIFAFGWITAFFVTLWLLGALVGIPAFALVYLLVGSRESPVLAVVYAFACWVFVYGLFDRGLHVPLPAGVLLTGFGL